MVLKSLDPFQKVLKICFYLKYPWTVDPWWTTIKGDIKESGSCERLNNNKKCPEHICSIQMIWVLWLFCFNLFWLSWGFVAACGPSLVAVSMSISILRVWWLLLLQGKWAPGQMGSVVVMHGCSCLAACGIFLDQGLNPCPLHWQADS